MNRRDQVVGLLETLRPLLRNREALIAAFDQAPREPAEPEILLLHTGIDGCAILVSKSPGVTLYLRDSSEDEFSGLADASWALAEAMDALLEPHYFADTRSSHLSFHLLALNW